MYKIYTKKGCMPPGYVKKFLLVMKITTFLLFVALMQVSAKGIAQKLTLVNNHITLKEVFKEINKQTGYNIYWSDSQVNGNQVIDANFKDASLKEVLNKCLDSQPLTFTINDKTVVIRKKEEQIEPSHSKVAAPDSIPYTGHVLDENGNPLIGATIHLKGSAYTSVSIAPDGFFRRNGNIHSVLVITYVGYTPQEYPLAKQDPNKPIIIKMQKGATNLQEVTVSTGYEDKTKKYSTGSFEVITAKDLQHSTDPNLLNRLNGITTSLQFGNLSTNFLNPSNSAAAGLGVSPLLSLTIRGQNTLNNNAVYNYTNISGFGDNLSGVPLVVIDGIASPYSIDQVNPDDVESVTILKDAAASSIWGSRASNGVIVIKTKKGKFNHAPSISFSSNLNVTDKVNLFYTKLMSTSDYVSSQIYAYQMGGIHLPAYSINQAQLAVSPVFEIMNDIQTGQLTQAEGTAQLDALRGNDVRNDMEKYIERNAVTQDYHLAVNGGSDKLGYNVSFGYDKNQNNTVDSYGDRFNFSNALTFKLSNKLTLSTNVLYSQENNHAQSQYNTIGSSGIAPFYLYDKLASANGTPLSVEQVGIQGYRPGFESLLASTYGNNILSYDYKPLDDINDGYLSSKSQVMSGIFGANYKFNSFLTANVNYNYSRSLFDNISYQGVNSWYVRNLINIYTNPQSFSNAFPAGGIYTPTTTTNTNQDLQAQLNFNKTWNKSQLTAIVGVDASQNYQLQNQVLYLGYNPETLTSAGFLNYTDQNPFLFNTPYGQSEGALTNSSALGYKRYPSFYQDYLTRILSEYANADYSYNKTYLLSASIRKDGSSLFGPGTNKTGTPYWSLGSSWILSNESFYNIGLFPYLKLSATFGYNGNVNPLVTSKPTLDPTPDYNYYTGLYDNVAQGAVNSKLRPEKSGTLNLALDFATKDNRISGRFDYYNIDTKDLLTNQPIDPTTGFPTVTYNIADLRRRGIDLELHWKNIKTTNFQWATSALFSYNHSIVTKLYVDPTSYAYNAANAVLGGGTILQVGADLSRLYAYRWAGLDPATGHPRIYGPNNQILTFDGNGNDDANASNTAFSMPLSNLHYFGSAVPVEFGSLINTFNYKAFSLTAIIKYELGFYFYRPSATEVNYYNLYQNGTPSGAEYANRWQKPGDELRTNVPSQMYDQSGADFYYQYADINVENGDNIRLQEVNLSYAINTKPNSFLKALSINAHVTNLGVIWRANKLGLDPEAFDYPVPRQYSLGLNAQF